MHALLQATSHALSHQDAATLEQLLEESRIYRVLSHDTSLEDVKRAVAVLTAQIRAAERHLGVSARERTGGGGTPWGR